MLAHHSNCALEYIIHQNLNVEYIEMESTNEWEFKFWPCDHGMAFNSQEKKMDAGSKIEYFVLYINNLA